MTAYKGRPYTHINTVSGTWSRCTLQLIILGEQIGFELRFEFIDRVSCPKCQWEWVTALNFHFCKLQQIGLIKQSLLNHFATFEHIKLVLWILLLEESIFFLCMSSQLYIDQHLRYKKLWITHRIHTGQIKVSDSEPSPQTLLCYDFFLQCLNCYCMWEEKWTFSASQFQVVCWWSSQMVLQKPGEKRNWSVLWNPLFNGFIVWIKRLYSGPLIHSSTNGAVHFCRTIKIIKKRGSH